MRQFLLVPLLLLSSPLVAQEVTLRGKVEDVLSTGQFVVDCSNTSLVSSAVNLGAFVGQHVLLTGALLPNTGGPLVNVSSLQPTAEIFEIPGNPQVGEEMRFAAAFTPGTRVVFFASLAPGFTPVGRAGTLLLDRRQLVRGPTGIIPAPGNLELEIAVPNIPELIGLDVYAQALLLTGSGMILSNPDCKEFQ